jgi:adenylate cyclase
MALLEARAGDVAHAGAAAVSDFDPLLDGLDDREREARLQLLEELHASGVSYDELERAVRDERLALLPVERLLGNEQPKYTARELAERADVDLGLLERQWQALGFPLADPDELVYTEADLDAARRAKAFADAGLPEEGLVEVGRVIGRSMANIASAVRELVGQTFARPGDTEYERGARYARVAQALVPQIGPTLQQVLAGHLREQIQQEVVTRAELAEGAIPGGEPAAVAFADLVGFTRLGQETEAAELGALIRRFNALAQEVVEPPVQVVKLIGDAAMLVAPTPEPLLDALLRLVDRVDAEGENFPQIHAGAAYGRALRHAGDWYGAPVNLASRLTAIARPGSILADAELKDTVENGDYRFSFAGRKRLKGIRGDVPVFRTRRADVSDD